MLILPVCLYLWARGTEEIIQLPVPNLPVVSIVILVAGCIICAWGMISLMVYGNGLPMNAYPPKYFVFKGIYGLVSHPIYFGSGIISFGLSLFFKSSSGFWLVSPLFCLAMVVFVIGYENENIKKAAGYFHKKVFFSIPPVTADAPSWKDRLTVFLLALLPWLIIYELFVFIGIPKDAIVTNLYIEQELPVLEWSEIFYGLPYLLVVMIPFILNTKLQVRDFIQDVWWAILLAAICYIAFPFIVQQRAFTPASFLGELIYKERSYDGVSAALPAFHVIWAFIIYKYFSRMFGLKIFWQLLAVLISLSCITNGSHSIPDVVAGYIVYLLVDKRKMVWNAIRQSAERIANSWKEWRIGNIRLINHGLYAGTAALVGMLIAGCCLGSTYSFAGFCIGLSAIVGAALWAQLVEGSPRLLRPYGYYGSVIGIFVSTAIMSLVYDISFMYLLAAFALAGPWFQILGRLRCLVQGCCHGKPCDPALGISFTHPQSRVLKIASLKGVPIHPTQLYSIGANIIIALLLIRCVSLEMPVSFIAGMYLVLNGLARFVEEALRGEPQTAYWKGLRLYQWLAIVNIIGGAVITCISSAQHLSAGLHSGAIVWACLTGIIAMIAYGVDFPTSGKRFARLTS
ncbi:MAG: prolipoprotein diacylglyceryl transferase [Chitinophagaceae bacterium]|nr:prolipoprotein diacylglyceryl transferase [Chitinophagaceae bacterium]